VGLLDHFDLCMTLHGERAASRMMRKFGIKFSVHHPRGEAVKDEFIRCKTVDEWRGVLQRWYTGSGHVEETCELASTANGCEIG
jgi:hypothetical protein